MSKLNIYIVEDEPLIARILKQTIIYMGHHVCGIAASFNEAVRGLQQANADLIITDIMLSGEKTGIDLANYINTHLHTPFIFQSSVTDPVLINAAMQTQPLKFIAKPLHRHLLIDAIAEVQAINEFS